MSDFASTYDAPSSRLSYVAIAFAVASFVIWLLAGSVDQGLYIPAGVLGIVGFGVAVKARREARRAGRHGRIALAAMIVGGLVGAVVVAFTLVEGVSQLV